MEEREVSEALRYLGAGKTKVLPETLRARVSTVWHRLSSSLFPRWTWRAFSLVNRENTFLLEDNNRRIALTLSGQTAEKMLSTCDHAALLACTLGAGFDTLLRAEQARDMAEAVILDACGSVLVEAGCDHAEQEIAPRFPGKYLTDRFSPGYGDLPLSLQREICTLLDTPRRLGLHVSDSFLMNPAKSVTAVLGISRRPQAARVRGCGYCTLRETCVLRKGGGHCEA